MKERDFLKRNRRSFSNIRYVRNKPVFERKQELFEVYLPFVNLKIPKEFLELRKLEDFKEPFRFFKTSTFVIKLTMAEDKLRHKASKMFKPNESDIIDIDTENT